MINLSPLVTVYITNYNYGRFIEEAVESVLAQTYPNIEIFIIDDGSTDGSDKVIEKYITHERIGVIYQQNQGLTKTNNVALRLAQGEFIVRLDADDKFKLDAIEKLVSGFTSSDVAMVFGNWEVVDEEGNLVFVFKRHDFEKDVTLMDCPAHGACTMFRTDYLRSVGGYDEELRCQDGYELWFRIVDKFKVKNLQNIIFEYRRHGDNLTGNEERILSTRSNILKKISARKGLKSKVFAFIPIRGANLDSRSMPFEKIGESYMIDLVLKELIEFNLFEDIVISTPDKNLISYLEKNYENQIIIDVRNVDSSLINKKLELVLCDYVRDNSYLDEHTQGVVLGIERPSKIFEVDNVVGVRPHDDVLFTHNGSSLCGINFDKSGLRLERDEIYQMVKGFVVFSMMNLKSNKSLWGEVVGHVVFDQKSAHHISTKLDLKIANLLYQEQ